MKKRAPALLLLLLLLTGCTPRGTPLKEPVCFYYPKAEYDFGDSDSVIDYEFREASGHLNDLPFLLSLYLAGPAEDYLVPLYPADTTLIRAEHQGSRILLQLSSEAAGLSDAHFTLAGACLALTCSKAIGTETVIITSGPKAVTIDLNTLLLEDTFIPEEVGEN